MPLLVIEIPWDPNIARLGGFLLTWHGLFTALGILGGVQLALRMARVVHYDEDQAYSIALFAVPMGIVGARALYVIEHWDFFSESPLEVFALNEGGISVWGAVIGGVLGGLFFARWRGYPIGRGLDIAGFGLLLGLAVGRLGDLVNGEHLSRPTDLPWGVVYTDPDSPAFAHSLAVGAHHPATTYEMLASFMLLGLMFPALTRWFRGRPALTFFMFLYVYAAIRFLVSFLRVDAAGAFAGLDVPQLISILTIVLTLPALLYYLRQPREADQPPPSVPGRVRVVDQTRGPGVRPRQPGRRAGDR